MSATTQPETYIVQAIINWVREWGGFAVHTPGSIKQANQPDIDGALPVHDGFVHFKVEAKVPGEDARPAQKAMLSIWGDLGYVVGVVHDLEEFKVLIQEREREQHRHRPKTDMVQRHNIS